MKKKIAIIGHVDHGKTILTAAIRSVLDKEQVIVHSDWKKEEESTQDLIFRYSENKQILGLSKSRLKKCQKGIHEYAESESIKVSESFFKSQWSCKHCGASLRVP